MYPALIWHAHGWEDIPAPVEGYGYGWTKSTQIFVTDAVGAITDDISDYYVTGYIDWNADRDPRFKGSLTVRGITLQPYVDYIVPIITMEREDGLTRSSQLGLFAIGMPVDVGDYTGTERTYELKDTTSVLMETILTKQNSCSIGTDFGSKASGIVAGVSLLRNMPAIGITATFAITVPAGTTRFDACKQFLQAGGKIGPVAEKTGYLTYRPPLRFEEVEPFTTWTGNEIYSPIRRTPNDELFANVIVVTNDDPNATPISARAYNRDAASPGSTVRLGREKGRKVTVSTVSSLTEAQALANRYVSEAASYYRTIATTVEMNPEIEPDSTVLLDYTEPIQDDGTGGERYDGKWWVRTFRIGFDEDDGEMPVELNQIVEYGDE